MISEQQKQLRHAFERDTQLSIPEVSIFNQPVLWSYAMWLEDRMEEYAKMKAWNAWKYLFSEGSTMDEFCEDIVKNEFDHWWNEQSSNPEQLK